MADRSWASSTTTWPYRVGTPVILASASSSRGRSASVHGSSAALLAPLRRSSACSVEPRMPSAAAASRFGDE